MPERHLSRRQFFNRAAWGGLAWGLSPWISRAFAAGPPGFVLPNFPVMKQPDAISCGPTCCSMLLHYYGVAVGIEKLKEIAHTRLFKMGDDEVGFTWPSRIQKTLTTYGLGTILRKQAKLSDVIEAVEANRPPIVLVRSSRKTWHYLVAIGHRQGRAFRLADPLGYTYWMSTRTFEQAWAFDGDLRGNAIEGRDCKVCRGAGKVAFVNCVFCAGKGNLPDVYRHIVESNLIERVRGNTLIVPNLPACV